jgi:hypothetical protein
MSTKTLYGVCTVAVTAAMVVIHLCATAVNYAVAILLGG